MTRILINAVAVKQITGGMFQIATNFLLKSMDYNDVEWFYIVSSDLDRTLHHDFSPINGVNYFVFPTQPDFFHTYFEVLRNIRTLEKEIAPDVIYSICAPSYFFFRQIEVMRFTNPWITNPNHYAWEICPFKMKVRMWLYCCLQKLLIKKADYFVTQTETAKEGIIKATGKDADSIRVVSNVLPSFFLQEDTTHIGDSSGNIHVACVAAPILHKNLDIIPDVLNELRILGACNVFFHTTILETSSIWETVNRKAKKYDVVEKIINHGKVSQKELADIYRHCHFAFIPTLLEVFSASLLEAMYFNLMIVATNFPFNQNIISDAGLYYEPRNSVDAANSIYELINNESLRIRLSIKMRKRLLLFSSYDSHFRTIKDFLEEVSLKSKQIKK